MFFLMVVDFQGKSEGLEGATPLKCWLLDAILGICAKCFRVYPKYGSFEMFPHTA